MEESRAAETKDQQSRETGWALDFLSALDMDLGRGLWSRKPEPSDFAGEDVGRSSVPCDPSCA